MIIMNNASIAPSELIINADGSIFHLHLRPEQIASKVILVGDPERVSLIASYFESIEFDIQNREFHSITGTYQKKRISVISTGIGVGNIDIVMNELDALINVDFTTRTIKRELRHLQIVRIGTCGGLQKDTPLGSFVCTVKSIGLDGLLNFYEGRDKVSERDLEKSFLNHMKWDLSIGCPNLYVVNSDKELVNNIVREDMVKGITVTSSGFFGPQGRKIRMPLADPNQTSKIQEYSYNGLRVLNYEMESSAINGLAALLGHKAVTCCLVIANRYNQTSNVDYKNRMNDLIQLVLQRI